MKKIAAVLLLASFVIAGCGGGGSRASGGTSAYTLASRACQTSGQAAADLAAQAAALDPKYSPLSAHEEAVVEARAAQQSGSDEQNITAITNEQQASAQVVADCASLARQVIPGQ